jgi:hypothetical protein
MKRFYREQGSTAEVCEPLRDFIDRAKDDKKEIVLTVHVYDPAGELWCMDELEMIDGGDCGRSCCKQYAPRNGKSGCCRFLTRTLRETGRMVRITHGGAVKAIRIEP